MPTVSTSTPCTCCLSGSSGSSGGSSSGSSGSSGGSGSGSGSGSGGSGGSSGGGGGSSSGPGCVPCADLLFAENATITIDYSIQVTANQDGHAPANATHTGQMTLSFAGVSLVGGQAVATFSGPRGIVTYNCTAGTWSGGIEHEVDGVFVLVASFANEPDLPSGFEIDQTHPNLTGENGLTGGQVEFGALSIAGVVTNACYEPSGSSSSSSGSEGNPFP